MSLLYECISGIIQGGILEAVDGTTEGEDVARLCVGKLRGMMVIEGDANCKLIRISIQRPRFSLYHSKICRTTRIRQNRPLPSSPCFPAARCHSRVY